MRRLFVVMIASTYGLGALANTASGQAGVASPQSPVTAVTIVDGGPSGFSDVPMGVHRIPGTSVYVSGHQKGSIIESVFGAIGVLVQSSINADAGKRAVTNIEDMLRFDIAAMTTETAHTVFANGNYAHKFTLSPVAGAANSLSVIPYVVLTLANKTELRPYVVLKTKLNSGSVPDSTPTRKYFCCEGGSIPLSGANRLTDNNGRTLKEVIASELTLAFQVMLLDRLSPYSRANLSKSVAQGYLPFVGQPLGGVDKLAAPGAPMLLE